MVGQIVTLWKLSAPLLRKTSKKLIEYTEAKLAPSHSLQPYVLVYLVQEGPIQATEREA